MNYLLAFAFWVAVFVAIGLALWTYVTLTNLLGMSVMAQGVVFLGLLSLLLAVSTVRGWDQS